MGASAIISGAIALGIEALKYINTKNANKYVDKLYKLKLDLLDEEGKGYDSDDSKIEDLYDQIRVTMEAANLVIQRTPPSKSS